MRLSRCRSLSRQPLTGTWFRAVQLRYHQTPLAYAHTAYAPTRFNPGPTPHPSSPVVYLAENPLVAMFEVNALFGSPLPGQTYAPNPAHPWAFVNVAVRLRSVIDLCEEANLRLIQASVQELTGDWRGYAHRGPPSADPAASAVAPTQRLGAALHALRGAEGFLTYSARAPTHRNLIVFPDKLRRGSFLRYTDPAGTAHAIP